MDAATVKAYMLKQARSMIGKALGLREFPSLDNIARVEMQLVSIIAFNKCEYMFHDIFNLAEKILTRQRQDHKQAYLQGESLPGDNYSSRNKEFPLGGSPELYRCRA